WLPQPPHSPQAPRPLLSRYECEVSPVNYMVVKVEPVDSPPIDDVGTGSYTGQRWLYCEGSPTLLFTDNETNTERLYGIPNASPYVKDSINDYIVHGKREAINPAQVGTKMAAHYHLMVGAGETVSVQLCFSNRGPEDLLPFGEE